MIIDSHLHIWSLEMGFYQWPDDSVPELFRNFEIADALSEMNSNKVDTAILVQAADNADETRHLIAVGNISDRVSGIVGWVPLEDPVQTKQLIREYRQSSKFVGVRTLIHTMPDPRWISSSEVTPGLAILEDAGLTYDFVTSHPEPLEQIPLICERHPELTIVIDHLGKPPVRGTKSEFKHWSNLIRESSKYQNTHAKLSGLYSSIGELDTWTLSEIRPFIIEALDSFGPERLMWGSDWPVSTLAGGYKRALDTITNVIEQDFQQHKSMIFGENASRIYKLPTSQF